MSPSGTGRLLVSMLALAVLAASAFWTMEPGKWQELTWVLLAFFAFRALLGWLRARRG